jgi:hypothetical protein
MTSVAKAIAAACLVALGIAGCAAPRAAPVACGLTSCSHGKVARSPSRSAQARWPSRGRSSDAGAFLEGDLPRQDPIPIAP